MEQYRVRQVVGSIVVILLSVPTLLLVVLHVVGPYDGAKLYTAEPGWTPNGVAVQPTTAESQFRAGDVVVAVNNVPMETYAANLLRPSRWPASPDMGDEFTYAVEREGQVVEFDVTLTEFSFRSVLVREWIVYLLTTVMLGVGLLVMWKGAQQPASLALLIIGAGAFFSNTAWTTVQVLDVVAGLPYLLGLFLLHFGFPLMLAGTFHFCLTFPQPMPLVERHKWIIPSAYLLPLVSSAALVGRELATGGKPTEALMILEAANWIPSILLLGGAILALILNWRRARDPVSRQKIRWVIFGFGVIIVTWTVLWNVPSLVLEDPLVDWEKFNLLVLVFPISIAIAILRHNLFDIDLILSRTMLWGTLTALVVGVYAGIVSLIGVILNPDGTLGPSLVAAGVVALLFQLVRDRVQRVVNRIVYGDRDDPYAVVSRLGERLESSISPSAVFLTITETVAQALKVPHVGIVLDWGDDRPAGFAYGTPTGDILNLPLTYQSDKVGELQISPRGRGEDFSQADRRLIDDLARQIGVAAHAVHVTEELQRSREQIVTAREEERRRLRRDLHDGVGPSLASAVLKLGAARNRLSTDPELVDAMLTDLTSQIQDTISDVRRVAYDLRPPALDEMGLIGALEEYAARVESAGFRIDVRETGRLDNLPAAVEVAAYRIAVEAVRNAIHHSGGSRCTVVIRATDRLRLTISDNGHGINEDDRFGIGLNAMTERSEELGGTLDIVSNEDGVEVTAVLPLRKPTGERTRG